MSIPLGFYTSQSPSFLKQTFCIAPALLIRLQCLLCLPLMLAILSFNGTFCISCPYHNGLTDVIVMKQNSQLEYFRQSLSRKQMVPIKDNFSTIAVQSTITPAVWNRLRICCGICLRPHIIYDPRKRQRKLKRVYLWRNGK